MIARRPFVRGSGQDGRCRGLIRAIPNPLDAMPVGLQSPKTPKAFTRSPRSELCPPPSENRSLRSRWHRPEQAGRPPRAEECDNDIEEAPADEEQDWYPDRDDFEGEERASASQEVRSGKRPWRKLTDKKKRVEKWLISLPQPKGYEVRLSFWWDVWPIWKPYPPPATDCGTVIDID